MSVAGVVARGRRAAEARMESTVAVMRKTGGKTTGADGFEVDEWATVYAAADFRLGGANQGSTGSRTLNVGGVDVQVGVRVGNFAYDTTDLADGDLIEVTAGENDGLVLRIVEADWQDQATARRVPVVATERPGEWA